MSLIKAPVIFHVNCCKMLTPLANTFYTSAVSFGARWRERKGLVKNPNSYGPLLTMPDYTFKDNRPTPYQSGQLRRIKEHQEHMKRIVQLVGEVDHAVERHARLKKEKEEQRQQILSNKLKPKGTQLITSK